MPKFMAVATSQDKGALQWQWDCQSPNWCQLVRCHRRQRSCPDSCCWDLGLCRTRFALKSDTDNTRFFCLCLGKKRWLLWSPAPEPQSNSWKKGCDVSGFHITDSNTMQCPRLCLIATTSNLGLGDWCPWNSSSGRASGCLQWGKGFSRR